MYYLTNCKDCGKRLKSETHKICDICDNCRRIEEIDNSTDINKEDIKNVLHLWSALCEGVQADLSFEQAQVLERKGLLENLEKLKGRGRYANRWTAVYSDLLKIIVEQVHQ